MYLYHALYFVKYEYLHKKVYTHTFYIVDDILKKRTNAMG